MASQAVIMAGGLGSRFGGRTREMPKGFIEIDGIAMVERSVKKLFDAGIEKIIIGTGHCNEFYDDLAKKYPKICTVKNENFANTSSMGTLAVCENMISDDFLLLESDILYDYIGLLVLLDDERKNVVLASGKSNSHDEVYLQADSQGILIKVSKDKSAIENLAGELVGISKVSLDCYKKMLKYFRQDSARIKIDYENVLCAVAKECSVFVRKIESLAWCEVDDEQMLERANKLIAPRVFENEGLHEILKKFCRARK